MRRTDHGRAHTRMGAVPQVIRALLVVVGGGAAGLAVAADSAPQLINIPVEDLGTALLTYAGLTHQQIAFDSKLVEGYKSTALSGTYNVAEGLQVLIGTAPFLIHPTPSGVLTVAAKPVPVAADARVANTEPAASSRKAPQDEVIVSAQRATLTPKVSAFVSEIAVLEHGEGLARWNVPVCPEVTGLPQEAGEFILNRIAEVARDAGVPLAGENCRPNLFVFVTVDPQKLLQAMEKRDRVVTFGHATPDDIDEFIASPRIARVWYNAAMETADNVSAAYGFPHAGQITQPSGTSQPGGSQGGGLPAGVTTDWERASRVARPSVWSFALVYVVIDQRRLQGVTRGQLADYVAMVGLAQIRPGAKFGDDPTILKLFDGAPQAAPPRMSDWDRAFIKSLYTVQQSVAVQKSEIALEMAREIAH
jgi:hypothetical protein